MGRYTLSSGDNNITRMFSGLAQSVQNPMYLPTQPEQQKEVSAGKAEGGDCFYRAIAIMGGCGINRQNRMCIKNWTENILVTSKPIYKVVFFLMTYVQC